MDRMDRLRELLQERADETGEVWLILDGFCHGGSSRDVASTMYSMHRVPLSSATAQERAQAVEEVRPW